MQLQTIRVGEYTLILIVFLCTLTMVKKFLKIPCNL